MKKLLGFLFIFFAGTLSAYSSNIRFIQVDSILYNNASASNYTQLVDKINQEKNIDFIVFTGNNISSPNKTELEKFLSDTKKLKKPVYVVLGQKDVNKQKEMSKKEYMQLVHKKIKTHKNIERPNYIFTKKDVVFIVVDGSKDVIPTTMGYYKEDVLKWLDAQLDKYKNNNVVILQHYPLIPPSKKEHLYTYKAEDYLQILHKHPNVKAVISGHFDTNNEQKVNGIVHISTKNAPTYRIIDMIDCNKSNPIFWSTIKD